MKYKAGYKYQVAELYTVYTGITLEEDIQTQYLCLDRQGYLHIKKGYCWDGASGIARDTDTFMEASLVHDALYQLMRESELDRSYKDKADLLMYNLCIKNKMFRVRAWYAYKAVQVFGSPSVDPKNKRPVLEA